jgi:photosystem II stability/assembly factor-like uncharacterized protein
MGIIMKKRFYIIILSIFFYSLTINAQWFLQNPLPTVQNLNDVFFVDSLKGWGVGANGTIIKTINGGDDWTKQQFNSNSDLYGIYFINSQIGLIVGDSIYKTTDGGNNWFFIYDAGKTLKSLQVIGPDTCWAVGDDGKILCSIDQGNSWEEQNSNTNLDLSSVFFINNQIGWSAGLYGIILKTTNGGINWYSQIIGNSNKFKSISFIDEFKGWVIGDSGRVYKTINGGSSWSPQSINLTTNLKHIIFSDSLNGWLVGEEMFSGIGKLIHSTDAGISWNLVNFIDITDGFNSVNFYKNQKGWIVGDRGSIFHTNDSGLNWIKQRKGFINGIWSVFFIDSQTGWVSGTQGLIAKTTDGGDNWLEKPTGFSHYLRSIVFTDFNNGWAAGDWGTVLKTTDGGETWMQQTTGITTRNLNAVYFINAQTGWAAGDGETVISTINGGTTWTVYTGNYMYNNFKSVHFVNLMHGWVCADNFNNNERQIYESTDGGQTWFLNWTGNYTFGFNDIYFVNDNYGWAVGWLGKILRTTNAGNSWTSQTVAENRNFFSVHFTDQTTGWVVGFGILKTTDGGLNWFNQNNPEDRTLMSVFFINDQTGWAVGSDGAIIKTDNGGNPIPVELNSFSANVINNISVQLIWSTATETNNRGFEIQRKTESTNWITIGFKEGKGTTTEPQSYSFTDKNLQPGKYTYRLKQVDFDGTYKYSDVVEVEVAPATFSLSQNYPNPFNPTTNIKYQIPNTEFVTLKVYDVLGNEVTTLVNEEKPAGSYTVEFNVGQDSSPDIASGVYFYQLTAGGYTATKKLILLK